MDPKNEFSIQPVLPGKIAMFEPMSISMVQETRRAILQLKNWQLRICDLQLCIKSLSRNMAGAKGMFHRNTLLGVSQEVCHEVTLLPFLDIQGWSTSKENI